MITDAILEYAGECARKHILESIIVRKITVWGRTGDSSFVSIRVELVTLPHEIHMFGGQDECVSIPGDDIGALNEQQSKSLVMWVVGEIASRVRRRAQRFEPQPGVLEILPLENE